MREFSDEPQDSGTILILAKAELEKETTWDQQRQLAADIGSLRSHAPRLTSINIDRYLLPPRLRGLTVIAGFDDSRSVISELHWDLGSDSYEGVGYVEGFILFKAFPSSGIAGISAVTRDMSRETANLRIQGFVQNEPGSRKIIPALEADSPIARERAGVFKILWGYPNSVYYHQLLHELIELHPLTAKPPRPDSLHYGV